MKNNLDDLVDQNELGKFWEKVYQMARQEFGTDDEGKLNKVQVELVDRTRFCPVHFQLVPYDHKAKTWEEKDRILSILLSNLRVATEQMTTHIQIFQDEKRLERAKREKEKEASKT